MTIILPEIKLKSRNAHMKFLAVQNLKRKRKNMHMRVKSTISLIRGTEKIIMNECHPRKKGSGTKEDVVIIEIIKK